VKNRRSILLLLLGIVLLGFVHVALRLQDGGRRTERRRTLVTETDVVCTLRIERKGGSSIALRRGEGQKDWRIVEPFVGRADEQAVDRVLDVLSLTPVVDVVSDAELVRLGRTRADFSLADRPLVRVSLGMGAGEDVVLSFGVPTPSADGVYASVEGVGAVFVVPLEVLSAVDRPTEFFRRRALFSWMPESISSFVLRQGSASNLSFVRENGGWTVDGELASSSRVERFLVDLLSSEALDFVWPVGSSNEVERVSSSLLAGYGLEPESAVAVMLKGVEGEGRHLSLGKPASPGRVYASVQNGSAIVTVKESLKTAALQKKAAFTDSRLFPLEEASVGFFRLVDGESHYVLARADDGSWRMETPVAAPAESTVVRRVLARILALSTVASAGFARDFAVSLSSEAAPVAVPKSLVMGEDRIDDLRSVEMVRVDPKEVRRLVRTSGEKDARAVSVVRGLENGAWTLESGDEHLVVRSKEIETILNALNPLVAARVEKLKVSAVDLDGYGLGIPFLTVAVDLDRENAVRRNILIGGKTKGGRFATIGSSDAVFVISDETVERLSAEPAGR